MTSPQERDGTIEHRWAQRRKIGLKGRGGSREEPLTQRGKIDFREEI